MGGSLTMATLADAVGQEIGTTDWLNVGQDRIQSFANCTEDRQWIHVDVERSKKESPFGGPVAHGMLTLSLLPYWTFQLPAMPTDAGAVLNYGFDKVRFLAPVKVGARVRSRVRLLSVAVKDKGRMLVALEHTVEIENEPKPAVVAEMLLMLVSKA